MWSVALHSKHPALGVKFIILLLVHYTSLHTTHLITGLDLNRSGLEILKTNQDRKRSLVFGSLEIQDWEKTSLSSLNQFFSL